jgi:hypothetical protein
LSFKKSRKTLCSANGIVNLTEKETQQRPEVGLADAYSPYWIDDRSLLKTRFEQPDWERQQ